MIWIGLLALLSSLSTVMFRHWRGFRGEVTVERETAEWRQVVRKTGEGQSAQRWKGEGRHRWTLRERPEHSPWGLLVVPQPDTRQLVPAEGQWESDVDGPDIGVSWILLFSLMSMRVSLEWPGWE